MNSSEWHRNLVHRSYNPTEVGVGDLRTYIERLEDEIRNLRSDVSFLYKENERLQSFKTEATKECSKTYHWLGADAELVA